jgi:hypothetical protein
MLSLVSPDVRYREQYLEMLQGWRRSGEEPAPRVLCEDCSDLEILPN